ncbi:related to protein-lysine N-methyltransferase [Rhynchosporium agropyri]|uniref:Histone-lysine N-methyltransferase, H3 lysine-79 specific n=1 Tax=Rhynchosporium agropyri TaxID=914238 RepID=A0A1E1KCG4_9HELO|nr:related to protein-lysine N-methyltransferase [Rhynchosporium agropyri]
MNRLFGGAKTGIKPVKGKVTIIQVKGEKKATPLPSVSKARQQASKGSQQSRGSSARPSSSTNSRPPSSASTSPGTSATPYTDTQEPSAYLGVSKRKASRQLTPSNSEHYIPLMNDDSDSGNSSNSELINDTKYFKRQRREQDVDTKRRLRSRKAFSDELGPEFPMIHAADLATKSGGAHPATASSQTVTVELRYPSASQRERFYLDCGKDKIDSFEEIVDVARIVRDVYLTTHQATIFKKSDSGVIRRLVKAKNAITSQTNPKLDPNLLENFKCAVKFYNRNMKSLLEAGTLATNLDNMHHLPLKMIQFIMQQVYDRAVSPNVELLGKYKPASDETYGELLSPFVDRVLQQCNLKSDQVFVDLGSGVGNVVLQAALEFGCESWGCEMMPNACELARKQAAEFKARCRLWGLAPGEVHLEEGSFFENKAIGKALKRADIVLVNNFKFDPETNDALRLLFLDLKDGCYIISLKSFAVGNDRNPEDPANLIQNIDGGNFGFGDVSWTGNYGPYYIATKDEAHLARMRVANKR